MASIVRNPRKRIYQIQWRSGTGWKRVKVATLPDGAKDFPKRDPAAVTAGLVEYQSKEDAVRAGMARGADGVTLAKFLAAYREHYATCRRPGSVVQLGFSVRKFAEWCAEAKVKHVSAVTPAVVDRFVAARLKCVAPASVRREAGTLSGAWTRAIKLRELRDNPWANVSIEGKTKRRTSNWTADEFARLVAVAPQWVRDALVLGCNTGLRAGALIRLEWRDVKHVGVGLGSFVVRPELDKAKAGYEVPMSAAAHDLIARLELARGDADPYVLHGRTGKRISEVNTLGEAIHKACAEAGLPKPDAPCHAMRRTFGRWAVLGVLTGRPIPVYVVSRWYGHHSIAQTEHYLGLDNAISQDWMAPPAATPPPATGPSA